MKALLVAGAFACLIGLGYFAERRMFGPRAACGGADMLSLVLEILSHLF
jgi:hypothetical protein